MINQPVAKIQHKGKELTYAISNDHTIWRVNTLFTKEPDTIAWIEAMAPGEVFVDVGANMGMYSVFAGVHGLAVHAFEPEAQNYDLLVKSLMFNELANASAYCVALGERGPHRDSLYLSQLLAGGSCHTIGEDLDFRLQKRDRIFPLKQGTVVVTLDSMAIMADYVKIDVDGLEHLVVKGGERTIRKAKSVLCEINSALPEHEKLCAWFEAQGFKSDPAQVEAAMRKEGTFKGCGNRIFRRD